MREYAGYLARKVLTILAVTVAFYAGLIGLGLLLRRFVS